MCLLENCLLMQLVNHLTIIVLTLLLHKSESSYVLINIGSTNAEKTISDTKREGVEESTAFVVSQDTTPVQTINNSGFKNLSLTNTCCNGIQCLVSLKLLCTNYDCVQPMVALKY